MKLVSIIIATYNRAHYLSEMLESVRKQVYNNWECIIVDDGSSDNTGEVIKLFSESDDRFIYVLRDINYIKGLPGCRNCGLDIAKGDFVQFCDDDDVMHPNHLSFCIQAMAERNLDFVHFHLSTFTNDLIIIESDYLVERELGIKDFGEILTFKLFFVSCSVFWKIDCFKNNRFNETLKYAEEWELYLRILAENKKGLMLNNVLYFNRKHPNSNTANYFRKNKQMIRAKVKAVLLVMELLKKKKLFNNSIIFYLIGVSIQTSSIKILIQLIKNNFSHGAFIMFYFFKMYFYKLMKK